ncbi:hypothetical protein [Herbaspirillum rhizosphaerae]|uniref:hypothetical protein n=1 Tax=Herbaspirillum rhizosphaerae TaxID=346179 RepID=UPI0012EEA28E|nr:hypothetical protein [Herbaspirillum rhizosphaerae]
MQLHLLKSSPRSATWTIVNVTGMGLYLLLASRLWPTWGEKNTPGGPGDAFYYLFILAPILLFFATINLLELYRIMRQPNNKRTAVLVWCTVLSLWIAVFLVDYFQGARNISADFS